jgi:hypothetical protein
MSIASPSPPTASLPLQLTRVRGVYYVLKMKSEVYRVAALSFASYSKPNSATWDFNLPLASRSPHSPPPSLPAGHALLINLHRRVLLQEINFKERALDLKFSPDNR